MLREPLSQSVARLSHVSNAASRASYSVNAASSGAREVAKDREKAVSRPKSQHREGKRTRSTARAATLREAWFPNGGKAGDVKNPPDRVSKESSTGSLGSPKPKDGGAGPLEVLPFLAESGPPAYKGVNNPSVGVRRVMRTRGQEVVTISRLESHTVADLATVTKQLQIQKAN